MRQVINPQLQFGEVDIGAIELDPKSRDDIPQLLRGLQHIYTNPELRARVFAILGGNRGRTTVSRLGATARFTSAVAQVLSAALHAASMTASARKYPSRFKP